MEDKNNAPRGYKLTLTRLDDGEEVLCEEIDCLIGTCHIIGQKAEITKCLSMAACTNRTILTTAYATKGSADSAKNSVASDFLISLKNDDFFNELIQVLKGEKDD